MRSRPTGRSAASLRPIGMPRGLAVRVDGDGLPITVARTDARGRPTAEARVERVEDAWRVAEAWWREGAQTRTYYRVLLDGGRPLTLFHDDVTGAWAEQPYSEPEREASG